MGKLSVSPLFYAEAAFAVPGTQKRRVFRRRWSIMAERALSAIRGRHLARTLPDIMRTWREHSSLASRISPGKHPDFRGTYARAKCDRLYRANLAQRHRVLLGAILTIRCCRLACFR
jgi:hypothetical protein